MIIFINKHPFYFPLGMLCVFRRRKSRDGCSSEERAITFLKWSNILEYSLKFKINKTFKLKNPKNFYMSNVKNTWEDKTIKLRKDLTLEALDFITKIKYLKY